MKNVFKLLFSLSMSFLAVIVILTQVGQILNTPITYVVDKDIGNLHTQIKMGSSGFQFKINSSSNPASSLPSSDSISQDVSSFESKSVSLGHSQSTQSSKEALEKKPSLSSSPQLIKDFMLNHLLLATNPLLLLHKSRETLFEQFMLNYQQSIETQATEKLAWISRINRFLQFLCLLPLLFLLIPFIIYLKYKDQNNPFRKSLRSVPFSLIITASCIIFLTWLLQALYQLQSLQVYLGVLFTPLNAIHLDALLAFKYAPLEPLAQTLQLYLLDGMNWETSAGYMDPLGTLNLIYGQLEHSSFVQTGRSVLESIANFPSLYGPFIACVSLFLVYLVFRPVIEELLVYPHFILNDQIDMEEHSLFTYIKQVLKVFWIEIRAFFLAVSSALGIFIFLFIIQLITCALAGLSLISLSIWMSELLSLNAAVPEIRVLFTLSIILIFAFCFNFSLVITLSFGVRSLYLIARDKFRKKVPFRHYPMLFKSMHFIFLSAIPKLLIQLICIALCFSGVFLLHFSQGTSMLLLGLAILIPTCTSWWLFPPTAGLVNLYQSDLLIQLTLDE